MSTRSPEEQEFYAVLTQNLGEMVLKMLPLAEHMGWDSLQAARPYLHAADISTGIFIDFVDWAIGTATDESRSRLRDVSPAWGHDDQGFAAALARKLTPS